MCGIAGYSGPRLDIMTPMLVSLHHRGPDDSGSFHEPGINMGATRISIIDRMGGTQPMISENFVLVFNGEIYNYKELREELIKRGRRFLTSSDTETVLQGFEEYGPSLLPKLNGMFAIALWDRRKQKLFLARDRFGEKPLFYSFMEGRFVFGSEIKTVLKHPSVGRDVSYEALSYYLSLRYVPAPLTIYKDIHSLPAGHQLIAEGNTIEVSPWYRLAPRIAPEVSEEEWIPRIETALRDSVRLRLQSDREVGAYLSGGIDSSTIVALMSQISPQVKTFCLTYHNAPEHKQDAKYARLVAQQWGTEHFEYVMAEGELAQDLEKILSHLDQPFAGVITSFWLSQFMAKHVTVALSGDGADDLFGSYGHHRLVAPIEAYRRASLKQREKGDLPPFNDPRISQFSQMAPWEWRLSYAAFREDEKATLFSSKGRELLGGYSAAKFLKVIYEETSNATNAIDPLNRMLLLDMKTLLPNEILTFSDMLSMRHSVEVRSPFLDHRLVELAFSIPGSLKIRGNTLKYILRKVAEKYLPKEIIERPKEGFVLPKNTWLRAGSLDLLNALSPERLAVHGLFDPGAVKLLVERFTRGDESLTFKIWTLIVFQLWVERQAA